MTRCPFCKKQVESSQETCPSCGRSAADHPSIQQLAGNQVGGDWADEASGELELAGPAKPISASHLAAGAGGEYGLGDDDPYADADASNPLELDRHSDAPKALPPPAGAAAAIAPNHRGAALQEIAEEAPAKPRPPEPAEIIARYPPPPARIFGAPAYFVRVAWRQLELRQDLVSLRRRRSPDVPLYERALLVHDAKSFAAGMAITCAALVVATFVFFLPVIVRFVGD